MLKSRRFLRSLALILSVGMLSTAAFAAGPHTLTVGPTLTDGTYQLRVLDNASESNYTVSQISQTVDSGANVQVTAPLAEQNKGFVGWSGVPDGAFYSDSTISFYMPDKAVNLTADYAPRHAVMWGLEAGSPGWLEALEISYAILNDLGQPAIKCSEPGNQIPEGVRVHISANSNGAPDGNYWVVKSCSVQTTTRAAVAVTKTDGGYYFEMPSSPVTISAALELTTDTPGGTSNSGGTSGGNNFTYTLTGTAGEGGRIVKEGAQEVREATDRRYSIYPDEGWEIDQVLVDGRPAQLEEGDKYWFRDVRRDHTIHVTFRQLAQEEKPEEPKPLPRTGR